MLSPLAQVAKPLRNFFNLSNSAAMPLCPGPVPRYLPPSNMPFSTQLASKPCDITGSTPSLALKMYCSPIIKISGSFQVMKALVITPHPNGGPEGIFKDSSKCVSRQPSNASLIIGDSFSALKIQLHRLP